MKVYQLKIVILFFILPNLALSRREPLAKLNKIIHKYNEVVKLLKTEATCSERYTLVYPFRNSTLSNKSIYTYCAIFKVVNTTCKLTTQVKVLCLEPSMDRCTKRCFDNSSYNTLSLYTDYQNLCSGNWIKVSETLECDNPDYVFI